MKVFVFCQNGLILGVLFNKNTQQKSYSDTPSLLTSEPINTTDSWVPVSSSRHLMHGVGL
jgi:hypothetical protein